MDLDTLFRQSDVICLHCPLFQENYHLLNKGGLRQDEGQGDDHPTPAGACSTPTPPSRPLKTARIGALGLDVDEEGGRPSRTSPTR